MVSTGKFPTYSLYLSSKSTICEGAQLMATLIMILWRLSMQTCFHLVFKNVSGHMLSHEDGGLNRD